MSSGVYEIGIPLITIIVTRSIRIVGIAEYLIYDDLQLLISSILVKSFFHFLSLKFLKAFHLAM